MQSVQPDNTDPMPLQQSSQSVGVITIRVVVRLIAAVVVLAVL